VVIKIFVPQRLAQYALAQQLFDRVLDPIGSAVIREAGCEATNQSRTLRDLA